MYGHFNIVLKNFIIERQGGEDIWNKIASQLKHGGDFDEYDSYDDDVTTEIINLATSTLGLPTEPFLEILGEYYMDVLRKKGFDEMLRNLGSNILEFLQNLDAVHSFMRNDFPEMAAPSFRCDTDSASDRMVLHYYSVRKGLHPVVSGFIKSAAKVFYSMHLKVDVISIGDDVVADFMGVREHVTFNILAKTINMNLAEHPPTFVAQTKKHSEKQILKEDVLAVKQKLEQIRLQLGEDALPLAKARSAKAKWKAVARISLLHKGFVPNYPDTLAVNPRMFIEVFPYHLIFDPEMKVHQSGIRIQQLMPSIRSRQAEVIDFFSLKYPNYVDLTYENVERFVMCPFVLELKKERLPREWTDRPHLLIKGQMFLLRDSGYYLYIASPLLHSWVDLEERHMKLADIPMWDVTRDFILAEMEYRFRIDHTVRGSFSLTGGLSDTRSLLLHTAGGGPTYRPGEAGGGEYVGGLREKLYRLKKDLDNERQRNDNIYYSFLPKNVVDMVRTGQVPFGEMHTDVTALFCDIVHFLPMVSKGTPNEVIGMLNTLQARFDKVTRVHETYKVDSIGDAYLVVGGIEEKTGTHAERVANTALGMRIVASEVKSPVNGETVQIRIGVHTGSIVAGVVGHRVPRFVVMGETAVVASKLESHGVPGKIHISPMTYRGLKNKGFTIEERGKIDLRGYGPLPTYFLVRNDNATEDELVGRPKFSNQDIAFINEGKVETPFDRKNKVHPLNESPSSGGSHPYGYPCLSYSPIILKKHYQL